MKNISLSKLEAIVGAAAAIVLAIIPALANYDWTSTAGVLGGIAGITIIVITRLQGWQKWENNPAQARELAASPTDTKAHATPENDVDQEAF